VRLLATVRLPATAIPSTKARVRTALPMPAIGIEAASSAIDVTGYWWVPEPMDQVWAYVHAHPPAGLGLAGTSRSSAPPGGRTTSEGIGWSEPDRPYAIDLEAQVGLAPTANGTLVRTDGVGVWLDPRPWPDTARGARLRVTVSSGCPRGDRRIVGVRNPARLRPTLRTALLPAARPTAALLCTYTGMNAAHPWTLVRHRLLSGPAAREVADRVHRLPLAHPVGGVTSCPADTGQAVVLAFGYRGRPDVDLWYQPTGCGSIANGFSTTRGRLALPIRAGG